MIRAPFSAGARLRRAARGPARRGRRAVAARAANALGLALVLSAVGAPQLGAQEGAVPALPSPGEAGAVSPATQASAEAAAAASQIRDAIEQIDTAMSAADQVAALTDAIQGYEQGLEALREGLRRASLRERAIRADFDARSDRLSRVLGVMATMQQSPETMLLLNPQGPEASARSAVVLGSVAPALRAEADEIRSGLDEIATVRTLEKNAADTLSRGLGQVQKARLALAGAMANRSGLPDRFGSDPAELTALVQSADTLDAFAGGIVGLEQDVGAPMADFEGAEGSLPMPVVGTVIRDYKQADAAGVKRPGLVISTAPGAVVTAPWPATIRYRGPLLNYGNVMIVEPARGYLLVLAGLDKLFGNVGDVIAAGEPLGLMAGLDGPAAEFGPAFVKAATDGKDAQTGQSLYLELRKGKETLDPGDWFMMNPVMHAAGTTQQQIRITE